MYFSIIVPVYNRPQEINALLSSLEGQEFRDFEVIIVEDGSKFSSEEIVKEYSSTLAISYYFIENIGQGFARNYGMEKAKGQYFVLFDSDCIIPSQYLKILYAARADRNLDAHGGPDSAGVDFSPFQKAINYSMTSLLTTGGIRGKLKDPGSYQARGYNMGLSRKAFEVSKGFIDPNKAEDIELSLRLKKLGFKLELVEAAFVYHKRKNNWSSFFAQSFSFGRNRINVSRYHPEAVKIVHLLPAFFLLFCLGILLAAVLGIQQYKLGLGLLGLWLAAILVHASVLNKSLIVGGLSIFTSFGQLCAYGAGLLFEYAIKSAKG